MKRDDLEKYIIENRNAFDDETPSLKVWANIDKTLHSTQVSAAPQTKKVRLWHFMRIAAAAALLVVASTAIGIFVGQNQSSNIASSELSAEYHDVAAYYERQLQERSVRLASYQHADNSIEQDLQQFDETLQELQQELQEVPKGKEETIINAMIQNYQAKILVLDRVLQQINAQQHKKNTDDGTVNL